MPAPLIERDTAVSETVARNGEGRSLACSGCGVALAITGVTGPKADEDGSLWPRETGLITTQRIVAKRDTRHDLRLGFARTPRSGLQLRKMGERSEAKPCI